MKNNRLIMNELNESIDLIQNGINKKNLYQSMDLLSRYYAHELNLSNFEIYNKLINFLKLNCNDYSDTKYKAMVEYYSTHHKNPLSRVESIDICQSELDIINNLPNKNLKNISLTLLCVAKYKHKINPNNKYWTNLSINQIAVISKVKEKNETICKYINQLYKLNLIKFNRKISNNNIQVIFASEPHGNRKSILKIHSFDTLIKEYNNFLKNFSKKSPTSKRV